MSIVSGVVEWLVFSWAVFPIYAITAIWFSFLVSGADKENEASVMSKFLVLVAALVTVSRYGHFSDLLNWRFDLFWVAVYLGVGFLVCMYKWFSLLHDFRHAAINVLAEHPGMTAHADTVKRRIHSRMGFYSDRFADDRILVDTSGRYYIDWTGFPICTWWLDWPYFLLSTIFDPIQRAIRSAVQRLRSFFHWTATLFSVKG